MRAGQPSTVTFLGRLFHLLDEHEIRYCVTNGHQLLPFEPAHDLDIAVPPGDLGKMRIVCQALRADGYALVQQVRSGANQHGFEFAWWEGADLKTILVDIMCEFRYRGLILASGENLVADRRRKNQFWIADPGVEFALLLAKNVLRGVAHPELDGRLSELLQELGRARAEKLAGELFGTRWQAAIVTACERKRFSQIIADLRWPLWWTIGLRNPSNPIRCLVGNVVRLFGRWRNPTGMFLVLLGPDGVGKSALITQLKSMALPFRQWRILHWRPMSILRHCTGPVAHPHAQAPHSRAASFPRMLVHLLDYWIGSPASSAPSGSYRPGDLRSYFHDILVDRARYRYAGPAWMARLACHLIPSPDVVLLLDADPEVILRRKQEVSADALLQQKIRYPKLSRFFREFHVLDASRPLASVAADAARIITDHLSRRMDPYLGRCRTIRAGTNSGLAAILAGATGTQLAGLSGQFEIEGPGTGHGLCAIFSTDAPRALADRGYTTNSFAVLPGRLAPRLLLPLDSRRSLRSGFEIYAPYPAISRIAKQVLSTISQLGGACGRILIASQDELPLFRLLRSITQLPKVTCSMWIGTSGRHPKLTVLAMNCEGRIFGCLKIALNHEAAARVRHEGETLQRLQQVPGLATHVPRALYAGNWLDTYVLFQSHLCGQRGPVWFGTAHEEFLRLLRNADVIDRPGLQLVEEVAVRCERVKGSFDSRFRRAADDAVYKAHRMLSGKNIRCGLSHGDFAPWNTRLEHGELSVFDWESARWDAPLAWDVFHFHVQVASLLGNNGRQHLPYANETDAASFLLYLLNSAAECAEEAGWDERGLHYRRQRLARELA